MRVRVPPGVLFITTLFGIFTPMHTIPAHKIVETSITAPKVGIVCDESTDFNSPEWRVMFQEALLQRYKYSSGDLQIVIERDRAKLRWSPNKVDVVAEGHHKKALQYAKNRQFDEAIVEWELANEANEDDPHYLFNMAIALFESKKFEEALEVITRTLEICPIYYRGYFLRARTYAKIRKFAEARDNFQEGLKFDPQNHSALLNYAATLSIVRDYDLAIAAFREVLIIKPNEVKSYFGLAKLYSTKGDAEKANECYRKVIELDAEGTLANSARRSIVSTTASSTATAPAQGVSKAAIEAIDTDDVYSSAYNAYIKGDNATAIALYERYLRSNDSDARTWSALASAYLRSGDAHKASEACQKALKLEPNEGQYYKQLAIISDFLGEPDTVIELVKKAQKLGKNDSVTLAILGKNFVLMGNFSEAIKALDLSLKKNKNNLLAHYFIAAAYQENRLAEKAFTHLNTILTARTNSPIKEKAERMMAQLRKK